jgi:hypothetical protein
MKNSTKWFLLSVAVIAEFLFTAGLLIIVSDSFTTLGVCFFSSGLVIAGLEALGLGIWDLKRKGEEW